MRIQSPTSRASVNIQFSAFDVVLAAASPFLALYIRNANILYPDGTFLTLSYCLLSLVFSLIAFAAFRIYGPIPRYLSVNDMLGLAKAVLAGELMTCVVLFTFTRLDGIPRSTPAIHALILGAGLAAARVAVHIADKNRKLAAGPRHATGQHAIVIGLNDVSVFFMKFLDACAPDGHQVIAVLDEDPRWIGRSVNGVRVFGPPAHLEALIEEFHTHGVSADRVVVGGEASALSEGALEEVKRVCATRHLELMFVPHLFGMGQAEPVGGAVEQAASRAAAEVPPGSVVPSSYFYVKRGIDVAIAAILTLVLMPFWLLAGLLALVDVGSPVLFWQQRTGLGGHDFQLYKIRTLRPAYDRSGRKTPEDKRLSWVGRLLRATRLDELPQLLNVLVGDMSLIGPRPLLRQDQPPNPALRLTVRPGISGWAQVNGGTLLTPAEKEELDAWYIGHASPWLDLRIMVMTLRSLLRGDRRSERALAQARRARVPVADGKGAGPRQSAASRFVAPAAEPMLLDERRRPAARSL